MNLVYGIKEGRVFHISEVPKGLACGCFCPECNSALVAKKGNILCHHFSHYNGDECNTAPETALHLLAKQIISEESCLVIPPVTYGSQTLFAPKLIRFGRIIKEQPINDIKPDIVATYNNTPIFVEILVTHKVDENKINKIRQLNISSIEIDLSNISRELDKESLKNIVLNDEPRKWLYNKKIDQLLKKIEANTRKIKITIDTSLYCFYKDDRLIRKIDSSNHIFGCLCYNCEFCLNISCKFEHRHLEGNSIPIVYCAAHLGISLNNINKLIHQDHIKRKKFKCFKNIDAGIDYSEKYKTYLPSIFYLWEEGLWTRSPERATYLELNAIYGNLLPIGSNGLFFDHRDLLNGDVSLYEEIELPQQLSKTIVF